MVKRSADQVSGFQSMANVEGQESVDSFREQMMNFPHLNKRVIVGVI